VFVTSVNLVVMDSFCGYCVFAVLVGCFVVVPASLDERAVCGACSRRVL